MTVTWILDPAYCLHIFKGAINFNKIDLYDMIDDQEIQIISDDEEINQFFKKYYDSTDLGDSSPFFLCDEWDTIEIN